MTEDPTQDSSEIHTLLADRRQLYDWLARLDAAEAPDAVRQRVRADYEGRLAEVVVRLGTFSETLSGSLQEYRARLDEVESQKAESLEERAEARLRHEVGEYTDAEWQKLDDATATRLDGFDSEIEDLTGEIGRLDEVLAQIAPSKPGATKEELSDLEIHDLHPRRETVDPGHSPERRSRPDSEAHPDIPDGGSSRTAEAPKFTPKGTDSRREGLGTRTLRFPTAAPQASGGAGTVSDVDEMTFIKSVTLETEETETEGRTRGGNSKTLKCAECGSMNRPTEWYCERCGAELAAL
jgi:hypothetical protein